MYQELDPAYIEYLDTVATNIQASEHLAAYLENEEDDDYNNLKEEFELQINALYEAVANDNPLQLVNLEKYLLDEKFEGLFLPRVLGYSVLRGTVDTRYYKYTHPQEHFADILRAIINSSNFEILKQRIGQSIQVGFMLSSDIWVTNLINATKSKRARYFLQAQKQERLRDVAARRMAYNRYKRQFKAQNFMSAEFPTEKNHLLSHFQGLKDFMLYRIENAENNESLKPLLREFVGNKKLQGTEEHLQIMALYAGYFEHDEEAKKELTRELAKVRENTDQFSEWWLAFMLELHSSKLGVKPEVDMRLAEIVDTTYNDQLSDYYKLIRTIHNGDFESDDVQAAVKDFYTSHDGKSLINEAVRATIFGYFVRRIRSFSTDDYARMFELEKSLSVYMGIFLNERFNKDLKDTLMVYVKKLLKVYIDKRGRDYQDIKKFVQRTWVEWNFMTEKQVKELFKTKRKKKKAPTA